MKPKHIVVFGRLATKMYLCVLFGFIPLESYVLEKK